MHTGLHFIHKYGRKLAKTRNEHARISVQVKQWQEKQRNAAQDDGYVCTILGRRRLLPDASGGGRMVCTPGLSPFTGSCVAPSTCDVFHSCTLS